MSIASACRVAIATITAWYVQCSGSPLHRSTAVKSSYIRHGKYTMQRESNRRSRLSAESMGLILKDWTRIAESLLFTDFSRAAIVKKSPT